MSDQGHPAIVVTLGEQEIWELEDLTPAGKLYLLASLRTGDPEQARVFACVPRGEVAVLRAGLIARGYAAPGTDALAAIAA